MPTLGHALSEFSGIDTGEGTETLYSSLRFPRTSACPLPECTIPKNLAIRLIMIPARYKHWQLLVAIRGLKFRLQRVLLGGKRGWDGADGEQGKVGHLSNSECTVQVHIERSLNDGIVHLCQVSPSCQTCTDNVIHLIRTPLDDSREPPSRSSFRDI